MKMKNEKWHIARKERWGTFTNTRKGVLLPGRTQSRVRPRTESTRPAAYFIAHAPATIY